MLLLYTLSDELQTEFLNRVIDMLLDSGVPDHVIGSTCRAVCSQDLSEIVGPILFEDEDAIFRFRDDC